MKQLKYKIVFFEPQTLKKITYRLNFVFDYANHGWDVNCVYDSYYSDKKESHDFITCSPYEFVSRAVINWNYRDWFATVKKVA